MSNYSINNQDTFGKESNLDIRIRKIENSIINMQTKYNSEINNLKSRIKKLEKK